MKLALLALGSFVASLVGVTAAVVMLADAEPDPVTVQAEQPEADADPAAQQDVLESAEDTTQDRGDAVVTLATSGTDTTEAEAAASVPSPEAEAVRVTAPANTAPPATVVPSSAQGATQQDDVDDNEESIRQLARIFSAMGSVEAADVLKRLDDAEIVGILSFLNSRKAAGVLSALPKERAAAVSRILMSRRGGKEGS